MQEDLTNRSARQRPAEPPVKSKRADATARLRQDVLDAALDCFSDSGVEAAAVAEIGRRAGVSIGSLYHHFDSKNGIAEALYLKGLGGLNAGLTERLDRCRSARTAVRSVVLYYAEWVTANRKLAGFLYAGDVVFSEAAITERQAMYRAHIRGVFERFAGFVERGDMRRLPLETYVPLISGPIQEFTARWLAGETRQSPEAVKNLFADAAWSAVKTPSA